MLERRNAAGAGQRSAAHQTERRPLHGAVGHFASHDLLAALGEENAPDLQVSRHLLFFNRLNEPFEQHFQILKQFVNNVIMFDLHPLAVSRLHHWSR